MIKIYSILNGVLIFLLLTEFFAPQASALMVRKGIEELTSQADSILIGKVKEMESRWNEERTLIYTYVTISVKQHTKTLSGMAEVKEVVVRVRGGEVGDIGLKVSDTPQFREGEEVFLFLRMEKMPLFSVAGLFQGKYSIEDGIAKNRILGVEILLDSFISQIKGSLEKAKGSQ
ncbi:hypothetical protein LCGC14_1552510 [marine sediment metagenome]|uniref:Uncharacterized protein n=1 Tax=marine sediment metagenome TaxID=412755 RepID=A0A0F9L600_9ZZZZ